LALVRILRDTNRKLLEKDNMEDLDVNGRITLK
jgi:hypothetical protein